MARMVVGSQGISAGSPLEQDFYRMKNKFPSSPIERCHQLPSDGSPSRLAQHHISEMSEALSAGHWVLKVLIHFTGMVWVFTLMAGSNPALSQCYETSLVRAGCCPKLRGELSWQGLTRSAGERKFSHLQLLISP